MRCRDEWNGTARRQHQGIGDHGAAMVVPAAVAQQKSLKEQLVGTWMLVSCDGRASGNSPLFCDNPSGSFNLDANGRYTLLITHDGRLWASSRVNHGAVFNIKLPAQGRTPRNVYD